MKIAVISDIHSNLTALTACLAFAKHLGAEGYAFLGDLVTDGPDPHKTIQLLRDLKSSVPCWFVRGNREEYLIQHHKDPNDGWKPSSQTGSLLYTYEHLSSEDLQFILNLRKTERIECPSCPPVRIAHASPTSTAALIYPGTEQADNLLKGLHEDTLFTGHSHLQFRYESNGKQIINPGALGIHRHGMTKAQFSLVRFESGRWIARMLNVDYDRALELSRYEGSSLMEQSGIWGKLVKLSILTGHNHMDECLELAQQLAHASPSQIVEDSYWEAAAKQLGLI